MQLEVSDTRPALHPSEIVVVLSTSQGEESLVVDRKSLSDNRLEIGQPIGNDGGRMLVELPRETYSGAWRVWVDSDKVIDRAA